MNPDDEPIVFGAPWSVYVRVVRLALEEKGIAYELVPVDPFAPGGPPAEHLIRHPFGRSPAFEHDGFRLYEAGAITRYIDVEADTLTHQPRLAPGLVPPLPHCGRGCLSLRKQGEAGEVNAVAASFALMVRKAGRLYRTGCCEPVATSHAMNARITGDGSASRGRNTK